MKTYEEVEVPAKKEKRCNGVFCDFCGRKGREGWDSSYYTQNETEIEVTIRHREGENYPSGGIGEAFKCDMCPDCFRYKLVPFLLSISQNHLEYEDWSY